MRALCLAFALPSLAAGHQPSGGGPWLRSEAHLQHAGGRTFPFVNDDIILISDSGAILDRNVFIHFKDGKDTADMLRLLAGSFGARRFTLGHEHCARSTDPVV